MPQPKRVPGEASRVRAFKATDLEWEQYTIAAELAGLSRSEWIRETLDDAAARAIDRATRDSGEEGE